jgi:hypothetical protein
MSFTNKVIVLPNLFTFIESLWNFPEPGFYQDNEFGIRLENIVTVVKANVTVSKIKMSN